MAVPSILMPAMSTDEVENSRLEVSMAVKVGSRERRGIDEGERRDVGLGRVGGVVRAAISPRPMRRGAAARKAEGKGKEGARSRNGGG
jgi:hypothetical protein